MNLFFYQNGWLINEYEMNQWLDTWIRLPSCQLHHILAYLYLYHYTQTFDAQWWACIFAMIMIYTNPSHFRRIRKETRIGIITKM